MKRLALELGMSFHRALLKDHEEDTALPGTLREKSDFVLSGDFVHWGN